MVTDADWDQLEKYAVFAQDRGISQVQAAFSWLAAKQPIASVIAGATRVEQVQQNAMALDYEMSAQDLEVLDAIFPPEDKVALF